MAVSGLLWCVCVYVSVCLCVRDYSRTTGYEAAYERYQQLQCHKGLKTYVAILLKPLRSGDMASKEAKKPICIMSTGLPRTRQLVRRTADERSY